MFTGLIQEVGTVRKAEQRGVEFWLSLDAPLISRRLRVGDSVSVNGCCLTAVEIKAPVVSFQAVSETLNRTVLGLLKEGSLVNLEAPLTPSEPLGGHFVQGHVDGTGEIIEMKQDGLGVRMKVRIPDALSRYVIEKGSIALDGISLTVASIQGREVEIALIPHTMDHTALKTKKAGDFLQIEVDLLAKYVEKLTKEMVGKGEKP